MRDIKFRQPIIRKGKFESWHYWGFLSKGNFSSPSNDWVDGQPSQQYTNLKDKNCKEIYEGDIIKINQPERTTQTHTGDNIPNGSYTEPLEANIKTIIDEIVWDKENALFKFGNNEDPLPLGWVIKEYTNSNEANQAFGGHWNVDKYWPEDLEYLLEEFKLKDLNSLLKHISGCEVIGNIYENPELVKS